MTITWTEAAARRFEPARLTYATPGALAQALDRTVVQTPMLDLIDATCVEVLSHTRNRHAATGPRKIIATPPQEGKSQRVSRWFPLWALHQNPDLRIAIASYEATIASRWGRVIRDEIAMNPQLGLRVNPTKSSQHDWEIDGHIGGVYTVGIGGALTGRPVDILIIDDPVKGREDADSETMREKGWDWWTDTAERRLSPGAPTLLVMTRWHPNDLAGRLMETGGWDLLSIPAQCEEAATDPLGRAEGEYLQSARGRTTEQWEAIKTGAPARTWSALYQQRPTPAEGLVFHKPWIEDYRRKSGEGEHTWVRRLVAVDPAVTKGGDETGIVVVALDTGGHAWVIDDRSLQGSPAEVAAAVWGAAISWRCSEIVVEDNQGGDHVLHTLETHRTSGHQTVRPEITRINARESKRIRAESVASLYQVGHVHHADDETGRLAKLEKQMTTWTGTGKSPDRMDALVHGLRALTLPRATNGSRSTRTR